MTLIEQLDLVSNFLAENPGAAQLVPRIEGELVGPYQVLVNTGAHRVTVDEPATIGGSEAGPSPIEMALIALGSCQAITYRLWATKLGIDIDNVRVSVEADYDARGLLGVAGPGRPGLTATRVTVTVEGPGQERFDELRIAVDEHCPVLDLFSAEVPVTTELVE